MAVADQVPNGSYESTTRVMGLQQSPTGRGESGSPRATRWSFGSRYLGAFRRRCAQKDNLEGHEPAIPALDRLAEPPYRPHLAPVHYAYDWLPQARHLAAPSTLTWPQGVPRIEHHDSLALHPTAARLPWPTGLVYLRQSVHWRESFSASTRLLELFAKADAAVSAPQSTGLSLAHIAAKVLQTPEEDRFTRFPMYLFDNGGLMRTKLLAETIVLIIIFDDSWEQASNAEMKMLRDDFLSRLRSTPHGKHSSMAPQSQLQSLLGGIVSGLRANGGTEVVDRLVDFCKHPPPQYCFQSMREYLDYRYIDVGMPYILACIKFSLGSSVQIDHPKLTHAIQLVGDHVSLANDLASYDKEKRAYDKDKTTHLINAVDVMRKLCGLRSEDSAKILTYTLQLELESQLERELADLARAQCLTDSEWHFLEACLEMLAGNIFASVVISRYGGLEARLKDV